MEILKRGIDPATRAYYGECKGCGTVVRVAYGELKFNSADFGRAIRYVACPICAGSIYPEPLPPARPTNPST